MARLIRDEALGYVTAAETGAVDPVRAPAARTTLEGEVDALRRLGAGAGAVMLGVLAGLVAGTAATAFADGDAASGAVLVVVAVLVAVPAAWIGAVVARAGRRVVDAYGAWADVSRGRSVSAWEVYRRQLTAASLVRVALGAVLLLAFVGAVALVYLAVAPSDPIDRGDDAAALLVTGLVWSVTSGAAAWCLLAAELRVVRSQSGRVTRSRS